MRNVYSQKSSVKYLLLLAGFFHLSACSMRDRKEVHSVSVDLPQEWKLNRTSSSMMTSYFPTPTSLTSFNCYALNVVGPGIPSDTRFQCTDPTVAGVIAGFVPVTTGTIDVLVPAGAARTVQLIGVQTTIGCPVLSALIDANGVNGLTGVGDPYLLGSSTIDIFDDAAVTITAAFDANAKAFQGCGGQNSNTPRLYFGIQGSNVNVPIQSGQCTPVDLHAEGTPSIVPDMVGFNISSANTTLYSDSYCTNAVNTVPYPTMMSSNQLYVKTSETSLSFTVQTIPMDNASNPIYGIDAPIASFVPVNSRFEIYSSMSQIKLGACQSISLNQYTGVNAPVYYGGDATQYPLSFHVNTSGNTTPPLSMVRVYDNATDCANNTNAKPMTSSLYGWANYNLTFASYTSVQTVYVKNDYAENLSVKFATLDGSIQQAGYGLSFSPWQSIMIGSAMGPSSGGVNYMPYFSAMGDPVVTGITIGGVPCGSFTNSIESQQMINCVVPPGSGYQPIYAQTATGSYNTGFMYQYLPSVVPGQFFNLSLGTVVPSTQVMVSGGTATNCTVYPALPTGLSLSPACVISGTADIDTMGQDVYTVQINAINVGTFVLSIADSGATTTLSGGTYFYMNGCLAEFGCEYYSPEYHLTLGKRTQLVPTGYITGPIPTNCSISPALPAGSGLTFHGDCSITGTPNLNDYNGISGVNLTTAYTITSGASSVVVNIGVFAPLMDYPPPVYVANGESVTLSASGGLAPYYFTIMNGGSGSIVGNAFTAPASGSGYTDIQVDDSQIAPHATGSVMMMVNYGPKPMIVPGQVINEIQGFGNAMQIAIEGSGMSCTGTLPAGLYWSGCMIDGYATAPVGTYTVSVTASNQYGTSVPQNVTISVVAAQASAPALIDPQTTNLMVGVQTAAQLNFAVSSGVPHTCYWSCVGNPPGIYMTNSCQLVGKIPTGTLSGSVNCTVYFGNNINNGSSVVIVNW